MYCHPPPSSPAKAGDPVDTGVATLLGRWLLGAPLSRGMTPLQFIVIVEKSTNQLFGCTKFLIFGVIARGATSCATHRNAASSTERSCSAASALSRVAGSNATRTAFPGRANPGSLMKTQLFETGGAILLSRKRIMAKNGSIAA